MVLTKEQRDSFEVVVKPVMKWISDNCHLHTVAVVNYYRAELNGGIYSFVIDDYVKD